MIQRDGTRLGPSNNRNVSKGQIISKDLHRCFKPFGRCSTRLSSVSSVSSSSSLQYHESNNPQLCSSDSSPGLSKSLLPHFILSGTTVAVFSAVVQHPSSTLTPLSCLYLLLLAIQYAVQPRLSRRYLPSGSNKQSVALVEEIVKCSIAAILWQVQDDVTRDFSWKTWSFQSSLWVAAVPASLYAIQGVLQYTSQAHLDALMFNGLSQTKTLFAALSCALVMGQRQSLLQIVGLAGLLGASWLMVMDDFPKATSTDKSLTCLASESVVASIQHNLWWSKGVIFCVLSAALSGLAGALSQKGLQIVGGVGRNAFFYTMEVSAFSGMALFINLLFTYTTKGRTADDHSEKPRTRMLFADWKSSMLIPIICKAWTGVLTALVHKHAGSVAKGFALMLGLVLAAMLQSIFPPSQVQAKQNTMDDKNLIQTNHLSFNQMLSTILVLVSGWLHFTHPPTQQ